MKVLFWGTPDFAVPSLRALQEEGHLVIAVVTQPDRPAGRVDPGGSRTMPSDSPLDVNPLRALADHQVPEPPDQRVRRDRQGFTEIHYSVRHNNTA